MPDPFVTASAAYDAEMSGNGQPTEGDAKEHEADRADVKKIPEFPQPIPASQLVTEAGAAWLWHGYLARGEITLLSALWKSGKTTLLAHLLRAFENGGPFCGQQATACRVLYVTEEGPRRWIKRRDAIGIADHVHFIVRPFKVKPRWGHWIAFIGHIEAIQKATPYDLIVLDTLVNLWPVRDENDASQVHSALMPLHRVSAGAAVLPVHHMRKGDGQEATASRGSGALTGFVDTIIELRRYDAGKGEDRKRVLSSIGRDDETPRELVVELEDGSYRAYGSREETRVGEIETELLRLLPSQPSGWSFEDIKANWEGETFPTKKRVLAALSELVGKGSAACAGEGVKGDAYKWWCPPPG